MKPAEPIPEKKRDFPLDALRGAAVFVMIGANMAAYVLAHPHPFVFRLYGSFAAPLFVFISGMMVSYTARTRGYGTGYFLKRGVRIILLGALVDLFIWTIVPFMTWDVLYLIGFAIPAAAWTRKWPAAARIAAAVTAAVFLPVLLEMFFGYYDSPVEYSLAGFLHGRFFDPGAAFHQWLIDGWFPVFPWLSFALAGAEFERLRAQGTNAEDFERRTLGWGIALAGAGGFIWYFVPGPLFVREGYSELFYPPLPGFVLFMCGGILILYVLARRFQGSILLAPLAVLGRRALFAYVFHLALIAFVLIRFVPPLAPGAFSALYAAVSAVVLAAALLLERLGRRGSRPE